MYLGKGEKDLIVSSPPPLPALSLFLLRGYWKLQIEPASAAAASSSSLCSDGAPLKPTPTEEREGGERTQLESGLE